MIGVCARFGFTYGVQGINNGLDVISIPRKIEGDCT